MTTRRRLSPDARRDELLDVGARLFAAKPYRDVLMQDVAAAAGVSRALLYQYFPDKRDLFGSIYARAAARLLAATTLDDDTPLLEQVAAGLDAHIDYFLDNRLTVLAANRDLAGDPVVQAIITDELAVLRQRLLDVLVVDDDRRELLSAVLMSWLLFVRSLSVEWLTRPSCSRVELRDICAGTLVAALTPVTVTSDER